MYAQLSLQNVKLVGAHAYLDLESTPVTISFDAIGENETVAAHREKIAEPA